MWLLLSSGSSSIDIDMDIGMIITSLAPSILIIVTYYFAKKKTEENHNNNSEVLHSNSKELQTIKGAVNGRLTSILDRIDALEAASRARLERIERLEAAAETKGNK